MTVTRKERSVIEREREETRKDTKDGYVNSRSIFLLEREGCRGNICNIVRSRVR